MNSEDFDEIYNIIIAVFPPFFKKLHRLGELVLKENGISRAHAQLMRILFRNKNCTMSDLGNQLCVSKPNVTVLVDKLTELGFAERSYEPLDRRVILVSLTAKGEVLIDKLIQSTKNELRENLSKLNDQDLNLLKTTINNFKNITEKML